MKRNSDARRHAKPRPFILGDTVLHKQPKHNKLTTAYNSKPHTVSKVKGSMVTVVNGHMVTPPPPHTHTKLRENPQP